MKEYKYSAEKNVQILIDLLKKHNIRKCVCSPGATNMNFVASMQYDGNFELYSAVDERGAAYMATGLAFESGEPVVITCTGATASRNYFPGLTEAFHRKLPILAVTATQDMVNRGNLSPQFIDRSEIGSEVVKLSVDLPWVDNADDEWRANLDVNRALLELRRHGGGPVHINLTTHYNNDTVDTIPEQRVIRRYTMSDAEVWPEIPAGRIAITVGAHKIWDEKLTQVVDEFCAAYDAVVFTDHSSGYHGKYKVHATLPASQEQYKSSIFDIDLLIHIGEHSGDYYVYDALHGKNVKNVWRVSEDGEVRDTFHKLTNVFEMSEVAFFQHYADKAEHKDKDSYYKTCRDEIESFNAAVPELAFSNIYLAHEIIPCLPENSFVHFGVSNTMRSWTFFELPETVQSIANIGCRGIDGSLSTVLGMSQADRGKIHFAVLGDLTFFYNINALGNRHVSNNLRILLVNNGRGTEFRIYQHRAQKLLGDNADAYVAAKGHNGRKSQSLIKHFAQDLGYEYMTASNKDELQKVMKRFLSPELTECPMLLEVFTDSQDESDALYAIRNIRHDAKSVGKNMVRNVLGEKGVSAMKKFMGR
ncbi:thiamine pyrophosphate-binding protein [Selenomonas sp. AE3005]|uniref:thiamine pyrophosphate-binding protein n=1 Tax=Selenomonas sp. AE3005 TaxID=1485543 RepID=UPI000488AD2E|nr:thiamine pyrophosphate-binding protein [Selenomonas sp. AE3005]